jgi:hypothetical protein
MPWHAASEDGKIYKYQYHPHGDKSQPLRAAPSAMNTVIVPNVTLPEVCHATFADPAPIPIPHHVPACDEWLRPSAKQKRILVGLSNYICTATNYSLQDLHEKFNKYGKEEWDY